MSDFISKVKIYQELCEAVKSTTVKKNKDDKNKKNVDWQKKANEIWNEVKKKSKNDKELANLTFEKINILKQEQAEKKITFFNKLVQVQYSMYI